MKYETCVLARLWTPYFHFVFFLCDGKTTNLEITPLFLQFNSAYDLVTKRENFPSRCCAFSPRTRKHEKVNSG